MKKIIAAIAVVSVLAGCQTIDTRAEVNRLVGQHESALIHSYGPPHRVYYANGVRYVTYHYQINSAWCEVTFTVQGNRLTNGSWRGSHC